MGAQGALPPFSALSGAGRPGGDPPPRAAAAWVCARRSDLRGTWLYGTDGSLALAGTRARAAKRQPHRGAHGMLREEMAVARVASYR
jgi:hypothetical protein